MPQPVRQPDAKLFPIEQRVELCRKLGDYVKDAFDGPKDYRYSGDRMILSNWARSAGTFDTVLVLAKEGYGDQVAMLSRALFETMLDSYWISINPKEAQRLATLHHYQAQLLIPPAWNEHERLPGDPELPTTAEALKTRDETAKLFGRHGEKHWTGLSLWKRILAVDEIVPQDKPGELKARYQLGNHTANLVLHGSGTAMSDRIGQDELVAPGVINTKVVLGPTTTYLTEGLRHAYWSYERLCLLVAEHRAPEAVAAIEKLCAEAWPRLRAVYAPALKLAGRNGQCPCGSGQKTKDCHGAV